MRTVAWILKLLKESGKENIIFLDFAKNNYQNDIINKIKESFNIKDLKIIIQNVLLLEVI